MTRKFEFRDNKLELDIAGNLFKISVNPNTLHQIRDIGTRAQQVSKNLAGEESVEKLEEAIDFLMDVTDEILGDGASDKIFADREDDIFDCIDVLNYIVEEVKAFRGVAAPPKAEETVPLNRAQRRAKRRKSK